MNFSTYHSLLRSSALVLMALLLFDSGILTPVTNSLSDQTQIYLANVVGIGASVTPTELNTLTAAITAQKTELDKREQVVAEREILLTQNSPSGFSANNISTYVLSVLLFVILVLLVLNYVLDFRRERMHRFA